MDSVRFCVHFDKTATWTELISWNWVYLSG